MPTVKTYPTANAAAVDLAERFRAEGWLVLSITKDESCPIDDGAWLDVNHPSSIHIIGVGVGRRKAAVRETAGVRFPARTDSQILRDALAATVLLGD